MNLGLTVCRGQKTVETSNLYLLIMSGKPLLGRGPLALISNIRHKARKNESLDLCEISGSAMALQPSLIRAIPKQNVEISVEVLMNSASDGSPSPLDQE